MAKNFTALKKQSIIGPRPSVGMWNQDDTRADHVPQSVIVAKNMSTFKQKITANVLKSKFLKNRRVSIFILSSLPMSSSQYPDDDKGNMLRLLGFTLEGCQTRNVRKM